MSVMEEIRLVGEQIFDHTALIQKELDKLLDNFERNERHKEFDGIIRASHSLVEATDVSPEKLLADDNIKSLNEQLKKTTEAISSLVIPTYQKEHEDYLQAIRSTQQQQLRIVQAEIQRQRVIKMRGDIANADSLNSANASELNLE